MIGFSAAPSGFDEMVRFLPSRLWSEGGDIRVPAFGLCGEVPRKRAAPGPGGDGASPRENFARIVVTDAADLESREEGQLADEKDLEAVRRAVGGPERAMITAGAPLM